MERHRHGRTELFGARNKDWRATATDGEDLEEVPAAPHVPEPVLQDSGFNTIKVFVIFGVIFGCFAAVYPKFIHPAVLYAYHGKTVADKLAEENFLPPKFHHGAVHPGINTGVPRSSMHDRQDKGACI